MNVEEAKENRRLQLDEAEKILGNSRRPDVGRANIEAELFYIEQTLSALVGVRSRSSQTTIRALRTLSSALRRAKYALPVDFVLVLGIDQMIYNLDAYIAVLGKKVVSTGKGKELLNAEPGTRLALIDIKPGTPKRNDDHKELAAEAALRLCRLYEIEPKTTKAGKTREAGKFCRLAAVLYSYKRGRRLDDLQHQCRKALADERKTGAKTVTDSR